MKGINYWYLKNNADCPSLWEGKLQFRFLEISILCLYIKLSHKVDKIMPKMVLGIRKQKTVDIWIHSREF